jgi:putative SOS response-associated peptidase YedK
MCGRYTLKTPPDQWGQLLLPLTEQGRSNEDSQAWQSAWQPRYNIAPTQNVLAIRLHDDQAWQVDSLRWGLVPNWASELSIGNRMINARSETIDEKRSFSNAFKKRRCLIVADGYYEWQKLKQGGKQACWIHPQDDRVMCFAGLWERNTKATDSLLKSCTIITTAASSDLSQIHDRMPAILSEEAAKIWMQPETELATVKQLLRPAEDGELSVRRVSSMVNNPRNESAECIEPQQDLPGE